MNGGVLAEPYIDNARSAFFICSVADEYGIDGKDCSSYIKLSAIGFP